MLLAAAVWALPGGGRGAALAIELLGAVMLAAIAMTAWRFGREHSLEFERLEVRGRAVVFGTLGLAALAAVSRPELWATVAGSVIWLVMAAVTVAGAIASWRLWREL